MDSANPGMLSKAHGDRWRRHRLVRRIAPGENRPLRSEKFPGIHRIFIAGSGAHPFGLGIDADIRIFWYSSYNMDVLGRFDPKTGKHQLNIRSPTLKTPFENSFATRKEGVVRVPVE